MSRIIFVTPFPDSASRAKEMAPDGFEFVPAAPYSSEYNAAIGEAEYLVGFVSELINESLYAAAPRLRLIQLLSAGYDSADLDAARVHVGQVCHETPALIKYHHAEVLRRVERISQVVGGPALHLGRRVGEGVVVLAVELAAIRIDANLRFRELQRTAFPTFSADESGEH